MTRSRPRARPAFVVTFAAVATACTKDAPIVDNVERENPPPQRVPDAQPSAEPDTTGSVAVVPTGTVASARPTTRTGLGRSLNPTVPAGKVRLASNGSCFVYKPFGPLKPDELRPPGTEPPRESVTCPPALATDPAYKACIGGEVFEGTESDDCVCAVGGNPPPLPRPVPCPK